jgi:hypothetical protein
MWQRWTLSFHFSYIFRKNCREILRFASLFENVKQICQEKSLKMFQKYALNLFYQQHEKIYSKTKTKCIIIKKFSLKYEQKEIVETLGMSVYFLFSM